MSSVLDRREFLGAAAVGALVLGGVPVDPARARLAGRRPVPLARGGDFPQGVASGSPSTRGVTVWTRLEGPRSDRELRLEVARDPDFRRVVHRRLVRASARRDHTVEARVAGPSLHPGSEYFYRFEGRDRSSPVGRFRTLPPPDSRQPVRIGFFSCQSWPDGYYNAHRALAHEDDLDLVISLGDYIYEGGIPASGGARGVAVPEELRPDTETLERYRLQYRLYRSDPDLRRMHARHPFLAVWDDHEVENDYAGDAPGSPPSGGRTVPFAERRRNAYRAFWEYMPMEPVRDRPALGRGLYRHRRVGRQVELFLLDGRRHRDEQPCDDALFCPLGEVGERTMLGRTQLEWLKQGLERSRATWKLVANQVMIEGFDIAPRAAVFPDQWDGYGGERRELLGHVEARGIENVSFLTGDFHNFFAAEIGRDGHNVPFPAVATEFVVSSISSLGLESTFPQALSETELRAANPHMRFVETRSRGYMVVEATGERLETRFVAVDALSQGSRPRELARLRVPSGVPRIEVVS